MAFPVYCDIYQSCAYFLSLKNLSQAACYTRGRKQILGFISIPRHALISPFILGKSVMLYAAETIPKLKTRTQKMGGSDQSLQQGEGGKKGKGKKKK